MIRNCKRALFYLIFYVSLSPICGAMKLENSYEDKIIIFEKLCIDVIKYIGNFCDQDSLIAFSGTSKKARIIFNTQFKDFIEKKQALLGVFLARKVSKYSFSRKLKKMNVQTLFQEDGLKAEILHEFSERERDLAGLLPIIGEDLLNRWLDPKHYIFTVKSNREKNLKLCLSEVFALSDSICTYVQKLEDVFLDYFVRHLPDVKKDVKDDALRKYCKLLQDRDFHVTGFHPIHWAIIFNDFEGIENILKKNPSQIEVRDKFGRTPLLLSILCCRYDILFFLLSYKAATNISDYSGKSIHEYFSMLRSACNGLGGEAGGFLSNYSLFFPYFSTYFFIMMVTNSPGMFGRVIDNIFGRPPFWYIVLHTIDSGYPFSFSELVGINREDIKNNTVKKVQCRYWRRYSYYFSKIIDTFFLFSFYEKRVLEGWLFSHFIPEIFCRLNVGTNLGIPGMPLVYLVASNFFPIFYFFNNGFDRNILEKLIPKPLLQMLLDGAKRCKLVNFEMNIDLRLGTKQFYLLFSLMYLHKIYFSHYL